MITIGYICSYQARNIITGRYDHRGGVIIVQEGESCRAVAESVAMQQIYGIYPLDEWDNQTTSVEPVPSVRVGAHGLAYLQIHTMRQEFTN